MSAPVTERGRTAVRGRTAAIPAQRGFADDTVVAPSAAPVSDPAAGAGQSTRRSAQQKAYARRDERVRRVAGVRTASPAGRPQFVLLIMVLLAVGLVATLWLSTAAAADSYRLQDATAEARVLSEQAERLKQEVAVLASAPELARRAGELGMVPVRDPARLVVAPDGNVEVVGQPRAAVAPPPPAPPAPPEGAQPPAEGGTEGAEPGGTTPGEAARDESTPDEAARDEPTPDEAARDETTRDGTAQLAAPEPEEEGTPEVDGGEPTRDRAGQTAGTGTGARAGGGGTDAG
ncbi:hypothetical protein K1T35_30315 [Pseudonocardia sp. DSM 110487]|uniref:hypothetical protein n=1 Tax=Pseudonocardia sp. DSM 110487 TaxID=2865833 RepID=UPI001C6A7059|nr:hypothetical protein [Pseudonocardia sp. DSM 110487]QYN32838.1 hypothetical protein K1T35_30315 [Pseudonocardia sp. DSM 110487]